MLRPYAADPLARIRQDQVGLLATATW